MTSLAHPKSNEFALDLENGSQCSSTSSTSACVGEDMLWIFDGYGDQAESTFLLAVEATCKESFDASASTLRSVKNQRHLIRVNPFAESRELAVVDAVTQVLESRIEFWSDSDLKNL